MGPFWCRGRQGFAAASNGQTRYLDSLGPADIALALSRRRGRLYRFWAGGRPPISCVSRHSREPETPESSRPLPLRSLRTSALGLTRLPFNCTVQIIELKSSPCSPEKATTRLWYPRSQRGLVSASSCAG